MFNKGIHFRSFWTFALCVIAGSSFADAVFEPLMWMVGRRDWSLAEMIAGFAVDATFFAICTAAFLHLEFRSGDRTSASTGSPVA
jgi:hypothetical protein